MSGRNIKPIFISTAVTFNQASDKEAVANGPHLLL